MFVEDGSAQQKQQYLAFLRFTRHIPTVKSSLTIPCHASHYSMSNMHYLISITLYLAIQIPS